MTTSRRQFMQLAGASLVAVKASACGVDYVPTSGVPQSPFDEESTAEQVTAGVDLSGKLAVVTGCTSGIGRETMRVLALRGAYVVGTSRNLARAEAACRQTVGLTTPVQLDLGDFESVVRCAEAIISLRTPIDILVCNAGLRGGSGQRNLVSGVEQHFAVNHLGHFILVNRLLGRLYLAWQGRVVVVASRSAYTGAPQQGIRFDDLRYDSGYSDSEAYGHSKLANVLFSQALAKNLRGTRITSNALHPGVIKTNITRNVSAPKRWAFGAYAAVSGKTIEQGAATSCYVATADAIGATNGAYFEDCNAVTVLESSHLYNGAMADRLMEVSQELTQDYLVEQQRPDWSEFENGLPKPTS